MIDEPYPFPFRDYDDYQLYKEQIPIRITPPPATTDGPTARWLNAHPGQPLDGALARRRRIRAVGQ